MRATGSTVEIFLGGKRLDSYERRYEKWKYTTRREHMPRAHIDQVEWTPERIIDWAQKVGPHTAALIEAVLAAKEHPQQAFKRCLGILRLRTRYGDERIEGACARALRVRALTCKSVAAILRNNLDRASLPGDEPQQALPLHENIRGGRYYH